MKITIFSILLLLVISGCKKEESSTDIGKIIISNTWMRPGVQNRNTAAFMKISNNSSIDDTLVIVNSDLAKVNEIHETYTKENDIKGMRHIEQLVIPANSALELRPGSFHIMLIGLHEDLRIGDLGSITLNFQIAGEIIAPLKVNNN